MTFLSIFKNNYLYYFTFIVSTACCVSGGAAIAQIAPDATLPNNTVVQPNGEVIEITEGTTAGNNLFHSFDEFSVPANSTALF